MHTHKSILKTIFGYAACKSLQRGIIRNVQARRNMAVSTSTGRGKSLSCQEPAALFDDLTVFE